MRRVIQRLVAAIFFATMCTAAAEPPSNKAMSFAYGIGQEFCKPNGTVRCTIYAVGNIEDDTPENFRKFLRNHGLDTSRWDGLSVELASAGGSVDGAMGLGRIFRARKYRVKLALRLEKEPLCSGEEYEELNATAPPYKGRPSKGCFTVKGEEPAICRSACIFAFVGAVGRSLGRYSYDRYRPEGGGNTIHEGFRQNLYFPNGPIISQDQIGFHAIQPVLAVDATGDFNPKLLKFGVEWGQRESFRALEYFEEMGVDRSILELFTKRPNASDTNSEFYYPSINELFEVGILLGAKFEGPKLEIVGSKSQRGLALTWSYSGKTHWVQQLTGLCKFTKRDRKFFHFLISGSPQKMFAPFDKEPVFLDLANLSIENRSNGPLNRIGISSTSNDSEYWTRSWGVRITNTRGEKMVLSETYLRRKSDGRNGAWLLSELESEGVTYQVEGLDEATEDPVTDHFVIAIPFEKLEYLSKADEVTFDFPEFYQLPSVKIETDEKFLAEVETLKQNCIAQ